MTSPCDPVVHQPKPPAGPPEPDWDGTVYNAATTSGISGVTVRLHQCDGQTSTEVADTTSDSNGEYGFGGGDFDAGFYYFAKCDMSGPLSGMTVASGSSNPTAALPVKPSQSGVDFSFE